jgi:hypothetical protein
MSGTAIGAIKTAAKLIGISEEEYRLRRASGDKWCRGCKDWHPRTAFGIDRNRSDGLAAICLFAKAAEQRLSYSPKPRPSPGRRFVPIRDSDKRQAQHRVNHLVNVGLLPRPSNILCCDCGHGGPGRRHEYDHYLGYSPEHHEHVQAVCSSCHRKRAIARGEWVRRAFRPRSEFCKLGHPMERFPDGGWRCKTCRLEYWKRYHARRKNGKHN